MSAATIAERPVPARRELLSRLEDDLGRFYDELRERLRSDVFLIDQGVRYLVRVRGKALRPFVVLAAARLFGAPNELTYRAAMIVELLHTATLIHDDVVDKAETRRRWPTFNRIWGNKYSVLFGDYLLAHSLLATLEKGNLQVVELLADTSRQMSQGQLKELARSHKLDMTRETYLSMIRDKTASLFRACARLGALTLDRSADEQTALAAYGQHLGLAFQIRDDVLDYTGRASRLGKPVAADIRDKKITLPLLCAMEQMTKADARKLKDALTEAAGDKAKTNTVIRLVNEQDGIKLAQLEAETHAAAAIESLNSISISDKSLLTDLAVFAARRDA